MKKIFLPLFFLTAAFSAQAQVGSDDSILLPSPSNNFSRSIAAKINPLSFSFGKLSLAGEWNYKPKRSVTFYLGLPISTTAPAKLTEVMGEDVKDAEIKFKSFSIGAGYRMYLGKRDMTGFYFEPILKYVTFDMEGKYKGEFDFGAQGKHQIDALAINKYSGFGITAQMGVQFMIAKRVTVDLYLLGPEANVGKVSSMIKDETGPTTDMYWVGSKQSLEKNFKENLKDIPVIGDKIEVEVNENDKYIKGEYNGFVPGLRAGITLGYRF